VVLDEAGILALIYLFIGSVIGTGQRSGLSQTSTGSFLRYMHGIAT
jgi:hypothetical protein